MGSRERASHRQEHPHFVAARSRQHTPKKEFRGGMMMPLQFQCRVRRETMANSAATPATQRDKAAFRTPTDLNPAGVEEITAADNLQFTRSLRSTHEVCEKHNDVATASLIEVWIDQTECRTWLLSQTAHDL
jgi:hypothetical protein